MKIPGARPRFVILALAYFALLFSWAILLALFGDRWSLLFLLSSFAPYLFAPLPIIFLIAIATRRREIWIGFAISVALAAWMYGGLFVPRVSPTVAREEMLTVMTYNLLDMGRPCESAADTIRKANPDVVAIQELNPPTAELIVRDLAREYPYQILDPQNGTHGMGILSRVPLLVDDTRLPGEWVGVPQVATIEWRGQTVTFINTHPMPTNFGLHDYFLATDQVEWTIHERERDVEVVTNFAAARSEPVIVLGDFNMTDTSEAYQIITRTFGDSWREAGWGLGHTFPAPDASGESRIALAGIPLPTWLVRIDYVFHSQHWKTTSAQIGQWDGVSDHRPVIAKLVLTHK